MGLGHYTLAGPYPHTQYGKYAPEESILFPLDSYLKRRRRKRGETVMRHHHAVLYGKMAFLKVCENAVCAKQKCLFARGDLLSF